MAASKPKEVHVNLTSSEEVGQAEESKVELKATKEATTLEVPPLPSRPDLVVALVKPIGVEIDPLLEGLKFAFGGVGYDMEQVRLSQMLKDAEIKGWWDTGKAPANEKERRLALMQAGTDVRKKLDSSDALAMYAVQAAAWIFLERQVERSRIQDAIKRKQEVSASERQAASRGTVVVISSLKHPDEVKLLRRTYGSACFVVGAYDTEDRRKANLARDIATKSGSIRSEESEADARELIKQDFDQQGEPLGQHLSETFARSDYFLDAGDINNLQSQATRFVELIFGHPFITPTRDEMFMTYARAASLRTACMARQVGACIASEGESVVSVGANEVPKAFGGQYWPGDPGDARDHIRFRMDPSDEMQRGLVANLLDHFKKAGWLNLEKLGDLDQAVIDFFDDESGYSFKSAEIRNITEFMRPVHAEMAAITDAARRGVSLAGTALYVTTFPCHNCARHIVSSGIRKVIYIEPYAKSLASEMHDDSISIEDMRENRVAFLPFMGVAPRFFSAAFSMVKRKNRGVRQRWDPTTAVPRLHGWRDEFSRLMEKEVLGLLDRAIETAKKKA